MYKILMFFFVNMKIQAVRITVINNFVINTYIYVYSKFSKFNYFFVLKFLRYFERNT